MHKDIAMTRAKLEPIARDPDETVDLESLIEEVVPDAQTWKQMPNPALGGERPVDMLNTAKEAILRNMLRAAKHGMVS